MATLSLVAVVALRIKIIENRMILKKEEICYKMVYGT